MGEVRVHNDDEITGAEIQPVNVGRPGSLQL